MAGLHFEFTGDNSNLMKRFAEIRQGMMQTQSMIESSGQNLDNILAVAQKQSVETAKAYAKAWDDYGMSTATAEERTIALNRMLIDAQSQSDNAAAKIRDLGNELSNAIKDGNITAVDSLSEQISKANEDFANATEEIENLKIALSTLGQTSTESGMAPMLFTEEDFNRVEEIKKELEELQSKRIDINISDTEFDSINEQIDSLNNELRTMQSEAEKAASKYGSSLGTAAAEASTRLFELNNAVNDQKKVLAELEEKLESAKKAYDEIKDSSDADYDTIANARAQYEALSQSVANANTQLSLLTAQQNDASTQWSQVSGQLEQHDSIMVKMLGGYDNYQKILGNLPVGLQSVIGGMNGMTGAAKAFIATPLGAVIAAITLAIQALTSWFNSSREGQMAFAKVSGYVGGVLNQLKEIVIWVGEAIYNAFSNPKQAVIDLWEAIKNNIVTRVKSVGEVFASLGKVISSALDLDWDGVKDNFSEMGKHWADALTGVENTYDKVSNTLGDINDKAKKNAELAQRERLLAEKKSKWTVEQKNLELELADARTKAYSGDKEAIKKAQELIEKKYKKERELAEENYKIIKEKNSLTTNSAEDFEAEDSALAQLKALDVQEKNEMRFFDRRESRLQKQAESLADKQQKENDDRIKSQEQLNQKIAELELENQKKSLQNMEESHSKRMRALDLEHKEELLKIRQKAKEFSDLNKKAGVTTGDDGLTDEQRKILIESESLANEKYNNQVKKELQSESQYMIDFLKEYGTFEDKKLAITREYNNKIAAEQNEFAIASLQKQKEEALKKLSDEENSVVINWQVVFGNPSEQSVNSLRYNLQKIKADFESKEGTLDIDQIKDYQEAITAIENELANRNPFYALHNSIKGIIDAKRDFKSALQEMQDAESVLLQAQSEKDKAQSGYDALMSLSDDDKAKRQDEITAATQRLTTAILALNTAEKNHQNAEQKAVRSSNAVGENYKKLATSMTAAGGVITSLGSKAQNLSSIFSDDLAAAIETSLNVTDELLESVSTIISTVGDLVTPTIDAIESTVDAASTGMQAASASAATSMSTLEKASAILAIIGAAIQLATVIAGMFNNDSAHQNEIEALQERIDQLQWELSNSSTVRLIRNTEDAIKKVKQFYSEARNEIIKSLGVAENTLLGYIMISMRQNEIYSKSVEKIADYWSNVGYTANKALGSIKYDEARKQLENLAEQQMLVYRQMQEEEAKKKTDSSKISDYQNTMAELAEQMADLINEITEDIIGGSAENIAKTLGDAFFEAAAAGEDALSAWGQKANSIIGDVVKKMMIERYLEEDIGKIFDKYQKRWFTNGKFNGIEAVLDSAQDLYDDIYAVGETFSSIWSGIGDMYQQWINDADTTSQTATSGYSTQLSEDTGSEIVGRLTAQYLLVDNILKINTELFASTQIISEQMRKDYSIREMLNNNVAEIRDYQQLLYGLMDAISKYTRNLLTIDERLEKIEKNTR